MAWTIYTGTITGQAGSLTTMLDTNLVAAGWSIAFTGTNKRAYRNGAGALARRYFRILDDTPGAGGAKEAYIQGFNTMTDVDTGTGEFPTLAQTGAYGGALIIRKSKTADATTRAYILAADDKTFILWVATGDVANGYMGCYAGDFYSYLPGDTNASALCARTTENLATMAAESLMRTELQVQATTAPAVQSFGFYLGGSHSGMVGSVQAGKLVAPWCVSNSGSGNPGGFITQANPADGGLWLSPFFVFTTDGAWVLRGKLRGIFQFGHLASGVTDGATFSGSGPLAAKAFRVVKNVFAYVIAGISNGLSGCVLVETSTPDSSS